MPQHPYKKLVRAWILIIVVLTAGDSIATVIGIQHSEDVRAWWPVGLSILLGVNSIYATLFFTIAAYTHVPGEKFVVAYHVCLAALVVGRAYFFYTSQIDWQAVNLGSQTLTPFQKVLHLGLKGHLLLLLVFLCCAAAILVSVRLSRLLRNH